MALAGLVALLASAGPAFSSGPWQTLLKPYLYADVIADPSEVWCATGEAGLLRFDRATGQFESIVREPGGLASNALTALIYDRSGRLWVGTRGSGLSYLSADRTRWDLLNEFDGLPSDTITVLAAQGDTLWIGTPRGIALWDGRRIAGTLPDGVNASPFRDNVITGVVANGDSVWVSTPDGIYYGRVSESFTRWREIDAGLPTLGVENLASDGARIFSYSSDTSWVSPFELQGTQWVRRGGLGGFRLLTADRGTILGSTSGGLFRWSDTGWVRITGAPISLADPTTWIMPAIDPSGSYFGASRRGFYEQTAGDVWIRHVPPQPPGNSITNLLIEGPRLYVNTTSEGIGRLDGSGWRMWPTGSCRSPLCSRDTAFFNSIFAYALLADRRGTKWFSTWGGIEHADRDSGAIERMDDSAEPPQFDGQSAWGTAFADIRHTFAVSSTLDSMPGGGGHWFGMSSAQQEDPNYTPIGIDYYDSSGVYVRNLNPSNTGINGLRSGRILALTTDRAGDVWVGNSSAAVKGIQWFTPPSDPRDVIVFHTVSPDDQAADVRGLVAAGDTIWALTSNDVRAYRRTTQGLIGKYPVPSGPADNAGHCIDVANDGTVWAGTQNGVRVYGRDGRILADLNVSNSPLAANEVRAIRVDHATGYVWIGTSAGLNRYDPGYVTPPPPAIPALDVRLYPNPALITNLGIGLRIQGNTTGYHGGVYDLSGRRLHAFSGLDNGGVVWDGRDSHGQLVRPGVFFVRIEAGGHSELVRVALLR